MRTALLALTFCACAAVAGPADPPRLACNLKAIKSADRPRYNDLRRTLGAATRARRELKDGLEFRLDGGVIALRDLAEWVAFERLCCPFLTFEIEAAAGTPDWRLALRGPEGVKQFLNEELK